MCKTTCAAWRKLTVPHDTDPAQTRFEHRGIAILVRRLKDGRCSWMAQVGWSDQWHDVGATMRNRITNSEFRFSLRRACHKLGVRY